MKKFVFALICTLFAATLSYANDITWGKRVVFAIKTIHYEGKIYSGALIASGVEEASDSSTLMIFKPRVLVYNVNFGFDKAFEIDGSPDEQGNSGTSPLCLNLGKKYTIMFDDETPRGPVARFISKDVVVIGKPLQYYATKSIGCSDVYFDPN